MSLFDGLLCETRALERLRGHRAERAERVLQKVLSEQRALNLCVEQARMDVEQARDHENSQQIVLLNRYRGQVVSFQVLSGWNEALHKVSAHTAEQQNILQSLLERQRHEAVSVERARKHVAESQRQVEKLRELSLLLAEEGVWPRDQD
ncbi:hypothetical protein [Pseudomonas psychrophila]|jgi:hypothetical protein|uniref:Type III secretion protein n=1 Tax=Pseudomonas psychrophila TaxID=122355 RepID=A0ABY0W661_9PSED|nr:hypothetical protein [Pseudomonas psychrophila]KAB0490509.1 hypothetical protein F7Q95_12770 [Pseudomonas psychrophila]KMN01227.1 hypothetical protein TU76_06240 [Pseudomonas psychrophila]QIE34974.1 hypothetical protein G5J76_23035 [Pseudomonas psychrophila]WVI97079.1 hypothetical protein VR624_20225 [Pseudomonas psychrophila]SDU75008.1 hypothetical protein SAMN04490201_4833 [Pseudomonas psychrophila]